MEGIKNILNQVSIINRKNEEILDATGGRFNMFRIVGVNHYENTHSSIVAELLNPLGSHALKSKFLKCFIENLGKSFSIENFDIENANVITEYSTNEGRIDILIKDPLNNAIIIENKIYASDQSEQLKRYDSYARKNLKQYQILYLTLNGNNASDQSSNGINYLKVSYSKEIIKWLEKCIAIASRFPMVRETIVQYINHLKILTNQDMDTKNKEEIVEVLSKVENLKSAKLIAQNYSATFNYLAKKYFNPKMEDYAKDKRMEYFFIKSDEFHIHFYLTFPYQWQEKCSIEFFIGIKDEYYFGIRNKIGICTISNDNRKRIQEEMKNLDFIQFKETDWFPFYHIIPKLTLDNWENDIIKSDKFIEECKEKIENILLVMDKIDF